MTIHDKYADKREKIKPGLYPKLQSECTPELCSFFCERKEKITSWIQGGDDYYGDGAYTCCEDCAKQHLGSVEITKAGEWINSVA